MVGNGVMEMSVQALMHNGAQFFASHGFASPQTVDRWFENRCRYNKDNITCQNLVNEIFSYVPSNINMYDVYGHCYKKAQHRALFHPFINKSELND